MKKFDSINVVPFIDIMLVLLAIVLATSTFIARGIIPINLPKADVQKLKKLKDIAVTIQKDGSIYFQKEKVSKERLVTLLSALPKNSSIAFRCDKDAKIGSFVSVMEVLKNLGFDNLYIVTKE